MSGTGYLRGRLPPLTPEATVLPIGPDEFCDLILDDELRHWAGGLLDWLRIANQRADHHKHPRPFPDTRGRPLLTWPDDAWDAYYRHFGAITAPDVIREWVLEDAAAITARAAANGRDSGLAAGRHVMPRLETLVAIAGDSPELASQREGKLAQVWFDWLNEQSFAEGPQSPVHIYVYAIKLLILARAGRRVHREAA